MLLQSTLHVDLSYYSLKLCNGQFAEGQSGIQAFQDHVTS